MKHRLKKQKYIPVAVAVLLIALCLTAVGLRVRDGAFRDNTPAYISLNTAVVGSVTDTEDYEAYLLEVPSNGTLGVSMNHDDMADTLRCGWKVKLYSVGKVGDEHTYRELTYFESFWSDVTSSWDAVGVTKGTYLVTVESGEFNLEEEFTLAVSFTPTDSYEREFNDTPETAGTITLDTPAFGSSSQRSEGSDSDYYRLDMPFDGFIRLTFSHEDESLPQVGWNISVKNEAGENLSTFSSKWSDLSVQSGALGLRKGTYYVLVEPVVVSATGYKLLAEGAADKNREYELNDTPEKATPLPAETDLSGSLSERLLGLDKDYYAFSMPEGGCIDVYFRHPKTTEDKDGWNVRVLSRQTDGTLTEITKQVSKWNDGGVNIRALGLKPGQYYLCVDADSMSYTSLEYSVRWMLAANPEGSLFEQEPNNSLAEANAITYGKKPPYTYGALISTDVDFDVDCYSFTVDYERNIKLEFFHDRIANTEADWIVSIVNEAGETVQELHSAQDETVVNTDLVPLPAGTYYVRVETGLYGSSSQYHFRLFA